MKKIILVIFVIFFVFIILNVLIIKLNDLVYLKSEDVLAQNIIPDQKSGDFRKQCFDNGNKIVYVKLSSKIIKNSCPNDADGCQGNAPREALVCGNKYIISTFYYSIGEDFGNGIFELNKSKEYIHHILYYFNKILIKNF